MTTCSSPLSTPERPYTAAELLPTLPYYLGYHPTDSLVCLFLGPDGAVVFSCRVDWDLVLAAPDDVLASCVLRAGHCSATLVIVCAYDVAAADADDEVLSQVAAGFQDHGIHVEWAGSCDASSWRGLACDDQCPTHVLDPVNPLVLQLIAAGEAPLPNRAALLAEVDPASDRLADLDTAARPSEPGALEQWRDTTIDRVCELLEAPGPDPAALTDESVALIGAACGDIRVRDVVLWRLTMRHAGCDAGWRRIWHRLVEVLRRVPDDAVPGVGAVSALVAWQLGEATRAMACLHRVWRISPQHGLAGLVGQCVDTAAAPSLWWQVMASLDEAECRHGSAVTNRRPSPVAGPARPVDVDDVGSVRYGTGRS